MSNRRSPTDLYYHSFCDYCHDYIPDPNFTVESRPIVQKVFHYEVNNETLKLAKRLEQLERANKYLLNTLKERSSDGVGRGKKSKYD